MFFFIQLLLASAFEIACGGWQRSSLRHYRQMTRSKATDLFFTALPALGLNGLWVALATFGLSYLVGLGTNRLLGLPGVETGNVVADGLLFYVVFSFFFYWNHRLFHSGTF